MKKWGLFSLTLLNVALFVTSIGLTLGGVAESGGLEEQGTPILTEKKFVDNFDRFGTIEETGRMDRSLSPAWWVNSGGLLHTANGIGTTLQGDVTENSRWHLAYAGKKENTDGGFHPQNIFRLITRSKWHEFSEESYFRIVKDNLSKSADRNESNGLLLFLRYLDQDNLYYAGIRVDGAAVIKKKIAGTYHTIAYEQIFDGEYDRENEPSLIPHNVWIGLRVEIENVGNNTVEIRLYIDQDREGDWQHVLTGVDDGVTFGGKVILEEGYAGIRTDFMDVEFDEFKIITY